MLCYIHVSNVFCRSCVIYLFLYSSSSSGLGSDDLTMQELPIFRKFHIPHIFNYSFDNVAVGGIRQRDNYSKSIDPKDRDGILQRCYKLWPSLKVLGDVFFPDLVY